jgi:hypothetical protein
MAASSQTSGTKPLPLYRRHPREYAIWAGMHQRCNNPRCRVYKHYGDRGIQVCRRWSGSNGFRHFLSDVGPQPFTRASIHRLDNDGDYTRRNVSWADAKTQARHMCSNRVLEYKGETKILVEWAERMGMKPGTLGARLAKGWSVMRALTRAVDPRRPFSPWANRRR